MQTNSITRGEPEARSIFRIVAGALFLLHGTMKMIGWPEGAQPMPAFDPTTQMGIAAIIEITGGSLMIVGLFTRGVALALAGEMAVAYYTVHLPQSPWPMFNNGEAALMFFMIWMYFVFAGAGSFSLDAAFASSRMHRLDRSDEHPLPVRVPPPASVQPMTGMERRRGERRGSGYGEVIPVSTR